MVDHRQIQRTMKENMLLGGASGGLPSMGLHSQTRLET